MRPETIPESSAAVGLEGERRAAAFLKRCGHRILYRNFKPDCGGEIDLVCRDRSSNELVFVEVKSRTRSDFGRPASAVDRDKQFRIAKGAMEWLRMLGHPPIRFRFDIVEVEWSEGAPPRITHIREAFSLPYPMRY